MYRGFPFDPSALRVLSAGFDVLPHNVHTIDHHFVFPGPRFENFSANTTVFARCDLNHVVAANM
jgi:hypothetical protein